MTFDQKSSPDCNLEISLKMIENSILDIQKPASLGKDNNPFCGIHSCQHGEALSESLGTSTFALGHMQKPTLGQVKCFPRVGVAGIGAWAVCTGVACLPQEQESSQLAWEGSTAVQEHQDISEARGNLLHQPCRASVLREVDTSLSPEFEE